MLFLTAFGIKAGLFPLFFWLPASYHTPPAAVGALLAGLLTKVGVYAMIRVFTLLFPDPTASVYTALLVMSAVTMVVGLIGALGQHDLRRVLSFNLVGHIGFTTVGLALWTPAALAGSILYVLHHMLVISTLFLVSGLFLRQRRTTDLRSAGGPVPDAAVRRVPRDWFRCSLWREYLRCLDSWRSWRWSGPMIGQQQYALAAIALARESADRPLDGAGLGRGVLEASARSCLASRAHQPRLGGAILAPVALLVTSDDRPDRGRGSRVPPGDPRCTAAPGPRTGTFVRCSGKGGSVLLGNMLLALAWAALQGEFSLATLVTGHVLGYLILLALVRGGVLPRRRTSGGCTAWSAW